ncbi:hypothetical protein [Symbiopectobacterium purcellii]|uniref:hypothetical protein n=1 Tax=Symbiopectobacterium purcellii TaxID=2871826 RepID=UPI003F8563ED
MKPLDMFAIYGGFMSSIKKSLITYLVFMCLGALNPVYALTNQQYKTLIYGAAAGGAWAGWGTLNSVLAYVARGGGPLTNGDGANVIATICGANAAAWLRAWSPPTDPISTANVILAATKAGAVTGVASTCRWVSNAFLELYYSQQQTSANHLPANTRRNLAHEGYELDLLQIKLAEAIDRAGGFKRTIDNLTATYKHECTGLYSIHCVKQAQEILRYSDMLKAAQLNVRQIAWDIANVAEHVANEEHVTIALGKKKSPRPS